MLMLRPTVVNIQREAGAGLDSQVVVGQYSFSNSSKSMELRVEDTRIIWPGGSR